MADKQEFMVGPNGGQYIGHSVDKKNYYRGQKFGLDHLSKEQKEKLLSDGKVVDVTGKTPKQINDIIAKYPSITASDIQAAMRRVANG